MQIRANRHDHGDVNRLANRFTATLFLLAMALQLANLIILQTLWPFLAVLIMNLTGAAIQFTRLIRSAFRD